MITNVLTELLWIDCFVYIDDIVIGGATLIRHLEILQQVFQRLSEAKLLLKPKKCHFIKAKVKVLGFIVGRNGIEADQEKVRAVSGFPQPVNLKAVKSFLGLCSYYRRFIKGFAQIAAPLHALAKKDVPFGWNAEQEEAFCRLKAAMTQAPVLVHFDTAKEAEIHPDASNFAIGTVVLQRDSENRERVVAYASRRLSGPECRYTTTEREALAIIYSCEKFRHFLLGRLVTVYTDHHSLCWLMSLQTPNSRLVRWSLRLQEYSLKLVHKPGITHHDGDCLSRYPVEEPAELLVMEEDARAGDERDVNYGDFQIAQRRENFNLIYDD